MKYTENELTILSENIGKAIRAYHNAIGENLKEVGEPVNVQGDDNEIDGIELSIEYDGQVHAQIYDKIKWDAERETILVHCTMSDFCKMNDWSYLTDLGNATDYLLEAICWK